jgi:hypothetical protein
MLPDILVMQVIQFELAFRAVSWRVQKAQHRVSASYCGASLKLQSCHCQKAKQRRRATGLDSGDIAAF